MRLWVAIVLAFSVFLAPLAVPASARAMAAPGCAGKAGHFCPCSHAPKSCQDMCASATAEVGVDSAPVAMLAMTLKSITHIRNELLAPDGLARGVDPPVPRA